MHVKISKEIPIHCRALLEKYIIPPFLAPFQNSGKTLGKTHGYYYYDHWQRASIILLCPKAS